MKENYIIKINTKIFTKEVANTQNNERTKLIDGYKLENIDKWRQLALNLFNRMKKLNIEILLISIWFQ